VIINMNEKKERQLQKETTLETLRGRVTRLRHDLEASYKVTNTAQKSLLKPILFPWDSLL